MTRWLWGKGTPPSPGSPEAPPNSPLVPAPVLTETSSSKRTWIESEDDDQPDRSWSGALLAGYKKSKETKAARAMKRGGGRCDGGEFEPHTALLREILAVEVEVLRARRITPIDRIPDRFETIEAYKTAFLPAIVEETLEEMSAGLRRPEHPIMGTIGDYDPGKQGFVKARVTATNTAEPSFAPAMHHVFMVESAEPWHRGHEVPRPWHPADSSSQYSGYSTVYSFGISCKGRHGTRLQFLLPAGSGRAEQFRELIRKGGRVRVTALASIVSTIRQWEGIEGLAHSALCPTVLMGAETAAKPPLTAPPRLLALLRPETLIRLRCTLNEAQLAAVESAVDPTRELVCHLPVLRLSGVRIVMD